MTELEELIELCTVTDTRWGAGLNGKSFADALMEQLKKKIMDKYTGGLADRGYSGVFIGAIDEAYAAMKEGK